jgi:hypothetical protein
MPLSAQNRLQDKMVQTNKRKSLLDPTSVLVNALKEFPIHKPPKRLWRFLGRMDASGSIDISALTEGKLNLTPPDFFNDPFEMWVGFATESLTEEIMLRSVSSPTGLFMSAMAIHSPAFQNDPASFLRALRAKVRATPDQWAGHARSYVGSIRSLGSGSLGATCFSAFSTRQFTGELGIRHWTAYGNEHRGYAIEYNGSHRFFTAVAGAKWLFPVNYLKKRSLIDLPEFDVWNDAKMWRTIRAWLAMKSARAWGNEKEWRLIHPISNDFTHPAFCYEGEGSKRRYYLRLWSDTEPQANQASGAAAINRVWLGCRADDDLKDRILAATHQPPLRHVEVWKLEPCERNFALRPVLIKGNLTKPPATAA